MGPKTGPGGRPGLVSEKKIFFLTIPITTKNIFFVVKMLSLSTLKHLFKPFYIKNFVLILSLNFQSISPYLKAVDTFCHLHFVKIFCTILYQSNKGDGYAYKKNLYNNHPIRLPDIYV